MDDAQQELVGKNITEEDIVSYALLPSVALQFFDERERGELKPEPLHTQSENGPAVAHDLHLAPVEFKVTVHGESYHIRISGSGQTIDGTKPYYIKVNDKLEEVYLEPIQEVLAGAPDAPTASSSTKEGRPKPSHAGDVTTPMPGRVVKLMVAQGDTVKAGDPLLVVEAMKMENRVQAPIAGKVEKIFVKEGDEVNPDETLIHLEE
jgi:pyruvate carboxylase subunit B